MESIERRLGKIDKAALASDARLERLFLGAVRRGWFRDCERDRLRYWAAAENALKIKRGSPGNLFVWIVSNKRWETLRSEDEDRATARLKKMRGA